MSFGIEIRDHLGRLVESTDLLSICVDVRTVAAGSGSYSVPASRYVVALPVNATDCPVNAYLSSSTTVNYSATANSSGSSIIMAFS